ncbi:MAG: hypothetical protein OEO19_03420 [Gammaproteobacteria bacterium]|nr:hypothetical protein [Gammaproteobacteria bacterium]MDH3448938.1 hypothetical protein [Gammaproteobacteria bacterium]
MSSRDQIIRGARVIDGSSGASSFVDVAVDLDAAVRKMTDLPARCFGLDNLSRHDSPTGVRGRRFVTHEDVR